MIRKKLASRRGLTLSETLVALAVFALLSVVLLYGTAAASKVYRNTVTLSEARTLVSTLTQSLSGELRYARDIATDGSGNLTSFTSDTFGADSTVTAVDGRLKIKEFDLVGAKVYSSGLKLDGVTVTYDKGIFDVTLTLSSGVLPTKTATFSVRALNPPTP